MSCLFSTLLNRYFPSFVLTFPSPLPSDSLGCFFSSRPPGRQTGKDRCGWARNSGNPSAPVTLLHREWEEHLSWPRHLLNLSTWFHSSLMDPVHFSPETLRRAGQLALFPLDRRGGQGSGGECLNQGYAALVSSRVGTWTQVFASKSSIAYHGRQTPGMLQAGVWAWTRNLSTQWHVGQSCVLGMLGFLKLCCFAFL